MQQKIRVAILMGGSSREREISFAGGRTVYDNLNKDLFEPLPVFVDPMGRWILLDWQYLYKGTIRDFYPPASSSNTQNAGLQLYAESYAQQAESWWMEAINSIGKPTTAQEIAQKAEFAFLCLHGTDGEDGRVQGLLELVGLPYSGSGIRPSSIGMDKAVQKRLMQAGGFATPQIRSIRRRDWLQLTDSARAAYIENLQTEFGGRLPLVVRPATQGSSIGVSIVHDGEELAASIDKALFLQRISRKEWQQLEQSSSEKMLHWGQAWSDVRSGLGFPARCVGAANWAYNPQELLDKLREFFAENSSESALIEAQDGEHTALVEDFIRGREFSCVVVQDIDGSPIALPPTEIRKGVGFFDYRAKYLPGLARKITPIDLPEKQIEAIRSECVRLFDFLGFDVYARIDGFIDEAGTIFLNDPNTTSGMLPSSFFFHQAAEIGLNPSQFLSYIVYASLQSREQTDTRGSRYTALRQRLETMLENLRANSAQKTRVGVFLGGYSSERHISVESGRNVYEKLASSSSYAPVPIFVMQDEKLGHRLFELPINLLLKDNADDIRDKILHFSQHPIIAKIQQQAASISRLFAQKAPLFAPRELSYAELPTQLDAVFIALHGRPGEDGEVQSRLTALGLPFNGSPSESAAITIHKYDTLQRLREAGFSTAQQWLLLRSAYEQNPADCLREVEERFGYPLIAKPVDDGCSSAVKVIRSRQQLCAFLELLFRNTEDLPTDAAAVLNLKQNEEFPQKPLALLETLITRQEAAHFLEITGGLLTIYDEATNAVVYEIFEPSETLSSGEVLSLEEKFLAGEGQNITPARFVPPALSALGIRHTQISAQVRADLERAARILGVEGYARIDAFVRVYADGRAETIIIEVNSLPGMTPATCIFHQCALSGYQPAEFIDRILQFGKQRQQLTTSQA